MFVLLDIGEIKLYVETNEYGEDLFNLAPSPPSSMTFIKAIEFSSTPACVTLYGNHLYVGTDNGALYRINKQTNKESLVLQLSNGTVSGVQVYHDELFVLSKNADKVFVYNMTGNLLRSWEHKSSDHGVSKLCVLAGKVIVPKDGIGIFGSGSLSVYTIDGQLNKQIGYVSESWKAMTVCKNNSIIGTDHASGSVYRINIDSGEKLWESREVHVPEGVVCYKDRYVLHTSRHSTGAKIWYLV